MIGLLLLMLFSPILVRCCLSLFAIARLTTLAAQARALWLDAVDWRLANGSRVALPLAANASSDTFDNATAVNVSALAGQQLCARARTRALAPAAALWLDLRCAARRARCLDVAAIALVDNTTLAASVWRRSATVLPAGAAALQRVRVPLPAAAYRVAHSNESDVLCVQVADDADASGGFFYLDVRLEAVSPSATATTARPSTTSVADTSDTATERKTTVFVTLPDRPEATTLARSRNTPMPSEPAPQSWIALAVADQLAVVVIVSLVGFALCALIVVVLVCMLYRYVSVKRKPLKRTDSSELAYVEADTDVFNDGDSKED